MRNYAAAARGMASPPMRLEIPYDGSHLSIYLRVPAGSKKPPVAIIVPGLDACKEELHAWGQAFVDRGIATVTIDGPGQGETAPMLPITSKWGKVIGAVIDVLEKRTDVGRHQCRRCRPESRRVVRPSRGGSGTENSRLHRELRTVRLRRRVCRPAPRLT